MKFLPPALKIGLAFRLHGFCVILSVFSTEQICQRFQQEGPGLSDSMRDLKSPEWFRIGWEIAAS